jgi:SAM-dependent methyltransferase
MNLDAVWHDLECGGYAEDLPLWRELADAPGGLVLDVGAGTGRVTLDLARRGIPVVALDIEQRLLDALGCRAAGLPVQTIAADAQKFELGIRFSLVIVPMQTIQLLGGRAGRMSFLRSALRHLEPGGLLGAAMADAVDCFDEQHPLPPPPDTREILGVRYSSQLLGVVEANGGAAIRRRRTIIGPGAQREVRDVVTRLARVSPAEVAAEARRCGYLEEPERYVPETERYLGSTVVVVRAPRA